MKIVKINSRNRRDFYADMQCEHCGYIQKDVSCYDDSFFHENVIPNMKCKKCNKTASEDYVPMKPKYSDYIEI